MSKTKIAVLRCESYGEELVYQTVKKGIGLIGGIGLFAAKGEKILLKVSNLVGGKTEEAITTHPSILNAMMKILLENNVSVTYGDSPGFEKPASALAKSGYPDIAARHGISMGDFEKGRSVDFPKGMACRKFEIANACFEADGIISLPKMKTHALTRITGAVKNQLGCVYGYNKAGLHVKYPNPASFGKMLVDLNSYLKPRLFVADAVLAMEGNGPRGGDPVKMNCVIVSSDPVAVDSAFCRMVDVDPKFVPTIKYGKIAGLGTYLEEELEFLGEPVGGFINKKFNIVRKPIINASLRTFLPPFLRNAFYPGPVIDPGKCVKCGICVGLCPVEGKALNFRDSGKKEPPVYDYNKCIRCYCCQEMCPYKAISVKKQ